MSSTRLTIKTCFFSLAFGLTATLGLTVAPTATAQAQ